MVTLQINGQSHAVDAPDDMPLLWVLRDLVGLTGTKFGCGMAQCGACTVHVDGQAIRSCVTLTSTLRWPAIFVAAAHISASVQRCIARPSLAGRLAMWRDPVNVSDVSGVA